MNQATVTKLAVGVFVLIVVSFIIRGFGQLLVGPRTAMLIAGPVALVAIGVLFFVVVVWVLSWAGITTIETDERQ